jgi:ribonucleoside-triphosphate reductase
MELAKRIEQLYKDKCNAYKEFYHLNFGVYYTPAESLCMTSYNKFLKKYKLIENVTAYKDENGELKPRGYFTNSIHVPVWEKISPFEKIDCEAQLVGYSSAGCITYVEIGDNAEYNLDALEQIILYAKSKDITYFAVNVPVAECTCCSYSGSIPFDGCCPKCGAPDEYIRHYARVTGYLSTTYKHFNKGKQLETKDRYVHVNNIKTWKTDC